MVNPYRTDNYKGQRFGKDNITPGDMVLRDRNSPPKNAPLPYLMARAMGQISPGMTEAKYNFMLSRGQDPTKGHKGAVTQGTDPFANPVVTETTQTGTQYQDQNNPMPMPPTTSAMGNTLGAPDPSRYSRAVDPSLRQSTGTSSDPRQERFAQYGRGVTAQMSYPEALNIINQASRRGGLQGDDFQKLYDLAQKMGPAFQSLDPRDPVRRVLKQMGDGFYPGWNPASRSPAQTTQPAEPEEGGGSSWWRDQINAGKHGMDKPGGPGPDPNDPVTDEPGDGVIPLPGDEPALPPQNPNDPDMGTAVTGGENTVTGDDPFIDSLAQLYMGNRGGGGYNGGDKGMYPHPGKPISQPQTEQAYGNAMATDINGNMSHYGAGYGTVMQPGGGYGYGSPPESTKYVPGTGPEASMYQYASQPINNAMPMPPTAGGNQTVRVELQPVPAKPVGASGYQAQPIPPMPMPPAYGKPAGPINQTGPINTTQPIGFQY